jgi:DNA polymerase I-like protein with 3'-5' exonuclease and polymerase domains
MLDLYGLLGGQQTIEYPEWTKDPQYSFQLVTSENISEVIDSCINSPSKRFALDLEASGLDNRVFRGATVDKVSGLCLCADGFNGWYLPLRHQKGVEHNVPWTLFVREYCRLMEAVVDGKVRVIFHNAGFDQEFLDHLGDGTPQGVWDSPGRWEDTMILAYLRNSRAQRKGLKAVAAASPHADFKSMTGGPGLDKKMLELDSLFPPEVKKRDFTTLDPSTKPSLVYACSDAICTYQLYDLLAPAVLSPSHGFGQDTIYKIEKSCSVATRWMERNRIPTDPKMVMSLIQLGQQEWFESVMDVYSSAEEILGRDVMPGYYKVIRDHWEADNPLNLLKDQLAFAKVRENISYPNPLGKIEKRGKQWPWIYDVNAPNQIGEMFDELGVPGLQRTEASGQIKTSKDVIDQIIADAEDQFPFLKKIKRFREVAKALTNYLNPLLSYADARDHTIRINFNAYRADTGRFSTPASDDGRRAMDGWPDLNFHSVPSTYDPNRPECARRIRECIRARPGFFIVASDYSGEELRLVTNLSREKLWEEEFFRCSGCGRRFNRGDGSQTPKPPPPRCPNCGSDKIGDLHTLTALSIYGQDAPQRPDWKQLRNNGKGTNFALCYGGGGTAVQRACKVDKNEGWRIKSQFDNTYKGLKAWWKETREFALKYGFVLTAWGRVYPLPDIWSEDNGFKAKAERNAINGPVQASGADVIKIAMALIYKGMKRRGWLDQCRMIATMHDELVFEIHGAILLEAIEVITETMLRNPFLTAMRWPIPLTSDCEMGHDWSVPWALNDMVAGEVRFDGDKKVKPPKAPGAGASEEEMAQYQSARAAWEAKPNFPASIVSFMTDEQKARYLRGPSTPTAAPAPSSPAPAPVDVALPQVSFDPVEYALHAPLTEDVCERLAEVILQCKGRGQSPLRLKAADGQPLTGWSTEPILVNEIDFLSKVRQARL